MTAQQIRDEARLDEACDWIVRIQAGDEADAVAFDAWLSESPANAAAFDRAMSVVDAYATAAPQVLAGLQTDQRRQAQALSRGTRGRGGLFAGLGALAAAAAVAAVVVPPMLDRPVTQTYTTVAGERRAIQLADGSKVDLNAGSTLRVTLSRHERRLVMAQGEAVFDVTHDARRPFFVEAGDRTVRVVGTQFDVRRRGADLAVTVARGEVEVRPTKAPGRAWRLHPGQRLDHRGGQPEQLTAAAPEEVFGWRVGRLVYRDQPLGAVVEDLNLQFGRPIRLEDPSLATVRVSGVLVLDDQDAVIRRLALLTPITAVTSPGGVVLRRQEAAEP